MLTMTPEEDGVLLLEVSGKLTKADYQRFVPAFEELAAKDGPLRVLISLSLIHI